MVPAGQAVKEEGVERCAKGEEEGEEGEEGEDEGGRLEGWKGGRVEGWEGGRMEGWKGGRLGGWKVGRVEGWEGGRWGLFALFHASRSTLRVPRFAFSHCLRYGEQRQNQGQNASIGGGFDVVFGVPVSTVGAEGVIVSVSIGTKRLPTPGNNIKIAVMGRAAEKIGDKKGGYPAQG